MALLALALLGCVPAHRSATWTIYPLQRSQPHDGLAVVNQPDGYGLQLQIVAISSNSTITHPQDGPQGLSAQAQRQGWGFPYLFDASQAIAKAFQAACTPDLFLFDGQHQLVYRGQLDASRPGNDQPLNGADLRAAIDALLSGQAISPEQTPSIGCNIKWHPQEP